MGLTKDDPRLEKLPRAKAAFVEPMKALLVGTLPRGRDWIYEIKFDGFRALAVKHERAVSLFSRNGKSLNERYPAVAQALEQLPAREAVLDGEVVALDSEGRSSFQLLQSHQRPGRKAHLLYYVFDLLSLNGWDVTGLPLVARKDLLKPLLKDLPEIIRFSESLPPTSEALIGEMKKRGLEGLVAKLKDSKYLPGQRTGAWVKFKWSQEQEFVIGGYTPPKGGRSHFGAILVGYYEAGQLRFASKVGSGFDTKSLSYLHQLFRQKLQRDCPFVNLPEGHPGGFTATEIRRCTWLRPELVCQVRFTEWTRDRHLRHPIFLGLRDDKEAAEVVRERPGG